MIKEFVDAGFDEVCVVQVGDDKEGFMQFWADELAPDWPISRFRT